MVFFSGNKEGKVAFAAKKSSDCHPQYKGDITKKNLFALSAIGSKRRKRRLFVLNSAETRELGSRGRVQKLRNWAEPEHPFLSPPACLPTCCSNSSLFAATEEKEFFFILRQGRVRWPEKSFCAASLDWTLEGRQRQKSIMYYDFSPLSNPCPRIGQKQFDFNPPLCPCNKRNCMYCSRMKGTYSLYQVGTETFQKI